MKIVEFQNIHNAEVNEFNYRLKKAGVHFQFPLIASSDGLSLNKSEKIYTKHYVVIDPDDTVRGGYILKYQKFSLHKKDITSVVFQLPLSEGLINKKYNYVSLMIFKDAFSRSDKLFTVGLGGLNNRFPKILRAFGWQLELIPFYFKIKNIKNFMQNISYFDNKPIINGIVRLSYFSGFLFLFLKINEVFKINFNSKLYSYERFEKFEDWADAIWENSKNKYILLANRNTENLNTMYPVNDNRLIRLKIILEKKIIGWCVLKKTKLSNHKQFGNMYLGSIVDCLCLDGYEKILISCANDFLMKSDVDLIVTNQSSKSFCSALQKNGFLKGPSNFALALSKYFYKNISGGLKQNLSNFHFNRGDGDGPINL